MRVGEHAKVLTLNRPTKSREIVDREVYVGKQGLLVRRLNVPWDPEVGELWELRFEDRSTVVFSDSELAVLRDGVKVPVDLGQLKEQWGKAPRVPSLPFRRFGAGAGAAPAVLALLVFAIAGVLLIWAGTATHNWMLTAAGAALVIVGIGAAGVLIN